MPSGNCGNRRRTSNATAVMWAATATGTRPGKNGTSPKFSIIRPWTPAAASVSASRRAASRMAATSPANLGLPGSGPRWSMPMTGLGLAIQDVRNVSAMWFRIQRSILA